MSVRSIISKFLFAVELVITLPVQGVDGEKGTVLGQTPQMGWNTWNAFHTDYNATAIEQTVDLLGSLGLKDAGYEYVVLDEGWAASSRTADGYFQMNSTSFPRGVKSIVDYVHGRGLKIGLYGDSGIMTCGFNPGSYGYEARDALTLANWEIDYWKYDNCGGFAAMTEAPEVRFGEMRDALALSGRDIFYSVCEWGYQFPWHWGGGIGHSYRMAGDITASFINETGCECKTAYCLNTGYAGCSVATIIQKMKEISQYQSPGHWADMDMLEIGNGNMSLAMQQTHFSFWSALKSPLIIGTDLSQLDNDSLSVLTNRDIIALNQDPLGVAVHYIESASVEGSIQIWTGPVKGGFVVLVFNEKSYSQTATIYFKQLDLKITGSVDARELWSGKRWESVNQLDLVLNPYQTLVFRLA